MSIENLPNKIIHYCWFGGNPLSELTKKCIESWKKYLPDFEIKEWNETNFDTNQCEFVKQAYEQKKWAFVSDYTRFKVLEEHGGLYLDTDMEITADIAKYLEHELFLGQEDSKLINAAVVWSKEKNNIHIENIVKSYEMKEEFNATGDLYKESVPQVLTTYFKEYGFDKEKDEIQIFDNNNVYIYPMEYFYPLSYDHQHNKFTKDSCMIHHFDATWISKMEKFKTDLKRKNMKWVVHIIDFFINSKNFLNTFINYKDISILVSTFFILFFTTLGFKPLYNSTENYIFNNIELNYVKIVIIEMIFSIMWTYICKKIRTIEINQLLDSNLLQNKENNYRKSHINDEKKKEILHYENLVFTIEIILSIILMLSPINYLFNLLEFNSIVFAITLVMSALMIYVGIKKKFKFRILDLLIISLLLALMSITNIAGMILSIILALFFVTITIVLKLSKKRLIVFFACLICLAIVFNLLNWCIGIFDFEYEFSNIFNVQNYFNSNIPKEFNPDMSVATTEFQFANNILNNVINVFKQINLLRFSMSSFGILILAVISIIGVSALNKDWKYIFLLLPLLFNTLLNYNYSALIYINYVYVLFCIVALFIKIFRKMYKNEKLKIN